MPLRRLALSMATFQGMASIRRQMPSERSPKRGRLLQATISRAVAGKYVQTPRGIFPLRMFFSGGKASAGGTDMAWESIRVKLREVIDAEDKSTPLRDDQIVKALQKHGITIARRTVAKYRTELNILPSNLRKVY